MSTGCCTNACSSGLLKHALPRRAIRKLLAYNLLRDENDASSPYGVLCLSGTRCPCGAANRPLRSPLRPRLLELQLTESVLMQASCDHNEVLLRLHEKGHRIAIDDLGCGNSSLDYLRRYPVDRIKIAETFG